MKGGNGYGRALTIAVTNYNGADVLPSTLAGVDRFRTDETDVLLLDDGSTDGSPERAASRYPWIDLVRLEENTGRLNLLRSMALKRAASPLVFLMDNDIVLRPGTLERLAEVLLHDPKTVCCTPRLVYRSDPETLYHDGGGLHYLCVSTAAPRGEPVEAHPPGEPRPTLGGGIMMVDRERALELGGFDEDMMLGWGDDGEFHFRCRIAGDRVLQVSDAVCEHFERRSGDHRITGQLRNRYRLLLTGYSARSLLLLAPALLLFEVALTVLAIPGGFFRRRLAALGWTVRNAGELIRRRSEVQALRRRSDREILEGGPLMNPSTAGASRFRDVVIRAGAACLDLYWRLVRRWV